MLICVSVLSVTAECILFQTNTCDCLCIHQQASKQTKARSTNCGQTSVLAVYVYLLHMCVFVQCEHSQLFCEQIQCRGSPDVSALGDELTLSFQITSATVNPSLRYLAQDSSLPNRVSSYVSRSMNTYCSKQAAVSAGIQLDSWQQRTSR